MSYTPGSTRKSMARHRSTPVLADNSRWSDASSSFGLEQPRMPAASSSSRNVKQDTSLHVATPDRSVFVGAENSPMSDHGDQFFLNGWNGRAEEYSYQSIFSDDGDSLTGSQFSALYKSAPHVFVRHGFEAVGDSADIDEGSSGGPHSSSDMSIDKDSSPSSLPPPYSKDSLHTSAGYPLGAHHETSLIPQDIPLGYSDEDSSIAYDSHHSTPTKTYLNMSNTKPVAPTQPHNPAAPSTSGNNVGTSSRATPSTRKQEKLPASDPVPASRPNTQKPVPNQAAPAPATAAASSKAPTSSKAPVSAPAPAPASVLSETKAPANVAPTASSSRSPPPTSSSSTSTVKDGPEASKPAVPPDAKASSSKPAGMSASPFNDSPLPKNIPRLDPTAPLTRESLKAVYAARKVFELYMDSYQHLLAVAKDYDELFARCSTNRDKVKAALSADQHSEKLGPLTQEFESLQEAMAETCTIWYTANAKLHRSHGHMATVLQDVTTAALHNGDSVAMAAIVNDRERTIGEKTHEAKEATDAKAKAETRNNKLKEKVETINSAKEELSRKLSTNTARLDDVTAQLNQLSEEKRTLEDKNANETTFHALKVSTLQDSITSHDNIVKQLNDRILDQQRLHEEEVRGLKAEIATHENVVTELNNMRAQQTAHEGVVRDLRAELASERASKSELVEQCDRLDRQKDRLVEQKNRLIEESDSFAEKRDAYDQKISKLQSQHRKKIVALQLEADGRATASTVEIERLKNSINALKVDRDAHAEEVQRLEAERREHVRQISGLEATIDGNTTSHALRAADMDELRRDRDRVAGERERLRGEHRGIQQERDRLLNQSRDLTAANERLKGENQQLKETAARLAEEREVAISERDNLSVKAGDLQKSLDKETTSHEETTTQAETLTRERDDATAIRDELERQVNALTEGVHRIRNERDEARTECATLAAHVAELQGDETQALPNFSAKDENDATSKLAKLEQQVRSLADLVMNYTGTQSLEELLAGIRQALSELNGANTTSSTVGVNARLLASLKNQLAAEKTARKQAQEDQKAAQESYTRENKALQKEKLRLKLAETEQAKKLRAAEEAQEELELKCMGLEARLGNRYKSSYSSAYDSDFDDLRQEKDRLETESRDRETRRLRLELERERQRRQLAEDKLDMERDGRYDSGRYRDSYRDSYDTYADKVRVNINLGGSDAYGGKDPALVSLARQKIETFLAGERYRRSAGSMNGAAHDDEYNRLQLYLIDSMGIEHARKILTMLTRQIGEPVTSLPKELDKLMGSKQVLTKSLEFIDDVVRYSNNDPNGPGIRAEPGSVQWSSKLNSEMSHLKKALYKSHSGRRY